jgi:Uma2 family endonuclease
MVQAPVAKFTVDDYHRMIEAGILSDRRVELINGLITEMTPEGPLHSGTIDDTVNLLVFAFYQVAKVRFGHPVILSNDCEPEPDVAIVKKQSYKKQHPKVADIYLVMEFSDSSLLDDKKRKRLLYAEHNIQEYWLVNLKDQVLLVYREPLKGDYQVQLQLQPADRVSPLAFPDVRFSVADLLEGQ